MISVVCVYNNKRTLGNILLKSLENQTVKFELITLDNTDHKFKSAAEALNYGGKKASGDYIMFAHQDMKLGYNAYLEDAEKILNSIPDVGIAGVAGMCDKETRWEEKVKYSFDIFDSPDFDKVGRVEKPEEVETLDECLLIVPRPVFKKIIFDEKIFDGWDCYGADYCLAVKKLNLKAYVIPGSCSHCTIRGSYSIWEFKGFHKYQGRLYRKYRSDHKIIHTFLGDLKPKYFVWIKLLTILKPMYRKLFPDLLQYLQKELNGYDTVLDLGCGHLSPVYRSKFKYSVGVDLFEPALLESSKLNIHSQYMHGDITKLEFKPGSFDVVLAIDVMQTLPKDKGIELLQKMKKWAKKKIIIKTPNGFLEQKAYNNNPYHENRSGWSVKDFKAHGFKVRGIGGWKGWTDINKIRNYKYSSNYNFIYERVSNLTQKIVYYYPGLAYELLIIKKTGKNNIS